jgi:hypothetical protein
MYDGNTFEDGPMSQLTSWPIPDLSFVRIGRQEASGSATDMIRELLVQGYQRVGILRAIRALRECNRKSLRRLMNGDRDIK